MHPLHVVCPYCHAEPGHACSSTKFPGMIIEHHARMTAAHQAAK